MKEFKLKIKYDFGEALVQMIPAAIEFLPEPTPDEQLFIAGLSEVLLKIKKKMVEYRPKYTMTLSAVQALSLRMFYTDCLGDSTINQASNKLRMIADEIHQHYS